MNFIQLKLHSSSTNLRVLTGKWVAVEMWVGNDVVLDFLVNQIHFAIRVVTQRVIRIRG